MSSYKTPGISCLAQCFLINDHAGPLFQDKDQGFQDPRFLFQRFLILSKGRIMLLNTCICFELLRITANWCELVLYYELLRIINENLCELIRICQN